MDARRREMLSARLSLAAELLEQVGAEMIALDPATAADDAGRDLIRRAQVARDWASIYQGPPRSSCKADSAA